ncbi:uncharacterized protein P174DRAFT_436958 [Aspergillus novofumigatus IBT 16806]|uniref:Uncharacterized protein n=1 Tax=Aspergillus novofumigatus (strain IBT 16806) TaxID=1392255 RepID=A0A2I1CLN3_ASPN1|nr:uncharacterized protein P174DRAFT_436958 [Aspergillus novofumigatus IBT 16806]PKX98533.1 hypothetical protein P174DRAFT_436958 [Aspergillus novofumigatus IBT 16806]
MPAEPALVRICLFLQGVLFVSLAIQSWRKGGMKLCRGRALVSCLVIAPDEGYA